MHDCASILDSIAKDYCYYSSHGTSLHRHSERFLHYIFIASRRNAVTRMSTLAPRLA